VTRALRVCNTPGCGALIEGTGKCPGCERERRAARPREPFYSTPKWKAIRKQYLERHPVCEEDGCEAASVEVHHIDGIVEHCSYRNLKALCKPCHTRVTFAPHVGRKVKGPAVPPTTPRGAAASQPVVGGAMVERVRRQKAEQATQEAKPPVDDDDLWPSIPGAPG
jgi:5-methylcytosine-specific restriction endonuclease McrA